MILVSNMYLILLVFWMGCGPRLDRPGYQPPPDSRGSLAIFQDAEQAFFAQMNYQFSYWNFAALNGVKGEVKTVISKYPLGTSSSDDLQISNLIELSFKSKMGSLGFEARDLECLRDYSRLCPSRWVDVGDGKLCLPPFFLATLDECKEVSFFEMTPLEKSQAAWNCGQSKYPCRHECIMDFSSLCPLGWKNSIPHAPTVCVAPVTYKQPCVRIYDFAHHNFKLKRKFADICKVAWPCRYSFFIHSTVIQKKSCKALITVVIAAKKE